MNSALSQDEETRIRVCLTLWVTLGIGVYLITRLITHSQPAEIVNTNSINYCWFLKIEGMISGWTCLCAGEVMPYLSGGEFWYMETKSHMEHKHLEWIQLREQELKSEKEKRGKIMFQGSIFNFCSFSFVIIYNFIRANSLDHIFLINSRDYIKNYYFSKNYNN